MEKYLEKKIQLKGKLKLETGLHIGDSKENVQIGGVDSPIVRRKDNNQPFIPGSSLKGKIRCLLEQTRGATEVGLGGEKINNLFGFAKEEKPSKIIVRDAYLSEKSSEALEKSEFTDFPYTEVKFENTIGRITGTAGNPRKIERVPVGAEFEIYFILNIWSDDEEKELVALLEEGVKLLESDYLGGSGSRGYGQIKIEMDFSNPSVVYKSKVKENV
ncbi:MAG: type III-A CRISPR-associated RAMP protein Csm3 [Lewinellaceae bacterium]|nr:type III-A CRISPR-associated RAMP protein Csm3 [Phaeodactylibacter sp.]MCB9041489.1 type III-A CRISPR-associated RAMP protein Csm3 [Lewinellaceae bacterium]